MTPWQHGLPQADCTAPEGALSRACLQMLAPVQRRGCSLCPAAAASSGRVTPRSAPAKPDLLRSQHLFYQAGSAWQAIPCSKSSSTALGGELHACLCLPGANDSTFLSRLMESKICTCESSHPLLQAALALPCVQGCLGCIAWQLARQAAHLSLQSRSKIIVPSSTEVCNA